MQVSSAPDIYQQAGSQYGVDPALLRAVVQVESGGNDNAVSSQGAVGPAQLMPSTAAALGVTDPTDPNQAIPAAAALLRQNFNRYGDPQQAIMAYHGGTDQAAWGPKTHAYLAKIEAAYQPTAPQAQPQDQAQAQPQAPADPLDSMLAKAEASAPQSAPQAADPLDAMLAQAENSAPATASAPAQAATAPAAQPSVMDRLLTANRNAGYGIMHGAFSTEANLGLLGREIGNKLGVTSDQSLNDYRNWASAKEQAYQNEFGNSPAAAVGNFAGNMLALGPVAGSTNMLARAGLDAVGADGFSGATGWLANKALPSALDAGASNVVAQANTDDGTAKDFAEGAALGSVLPAAVAGVRGATGVVAKAGRLFTPSGKDLIANKIIDQFAGGPLNVDSSQLVDGSTPTLAEAASGGNAGLAQLQDAVRASSPNSFTPVEAAQQEARVNALQSASDAIGQKAGDLDTQASAINAARDNVAASLPDAIDQQNASAQVRVPLQTKYQSLLDTRSANAQQNYADAAAASAADEDAVRGTLDYSNPYNPVPRVSGATSQIQGLISGIDSQLEGASKGPVTDALKAARGVFFTNDDVPLQGASGLESARQNLNSLISQAAGDKATQRPLLALRNQIENLPSYQMARGTYAADSEPLGLYEQAKPGDSIAGNTIPQIVNRDSFGYDAPRLTDSQIADHFLTGQATKEALDSLIAAHGGDTDAALSPLRGYLSGKVQSAIGDDGTVNIPALNKALSPYQNAIGYHFPEIADSVNSLRSLQQQANDVASQATALRGVQSNTDNLIRSGKVTPVAVNRLADGYRPVSALLSGTDAPDSIASVQNDLTRSGQKYAGLPVNSATSQRTKTNQALDEAIASQIPLSPVLNRAPALAGSIVGGFLGHHFGELGTGAGASVGGALGSRVKGLDSSIRNAIVNQLTNPDAYVAAARANAGSNPNALLDRAEPYILPLGAVSVPSVSPAIARSSNNRSR